MGYLYITDDTAKINLEANYMMVTYKDGMVTKIPIETLESISIFGRCQVSTQCVQECLKRGIPISYYSKGGVYFGRLHSTGHVNVQRQRVQANCIGSKFALELSKRIIHSKIRNQSVVMRRYSKSKEEDAARSYTQMKILSQKVLESKSINQLMGYEGNAARIYFRTIGNLVTDEFSFQRRSKRPPLDAFNSMLSLGYSILMNEIYGKIELKGLNPYFGFMHQDHEKHPTLASDLMEEWRAVLVDSLVMGLVNGHEIHPVHFYKEEQDGGVYLTKEGMKVFLLKFEKRLRQKQHYLNYIDYSVSFRRAMELQIEMFTKAMENDDACLYEPIRIR